MTLILTIFLLVFINELIGWIGKTVLQQLAWAVYERVFHSRSAARQRALKTEVLKKKNELRQTSAQDQFAKWARLRRSVDKGLADLEKLNNETSGAKPSFNMKFNSVLWILSTGTQFALGWWYRSSAVFFLPPTWLGPLTWWLAFPFAPSGSVSCGVWQMACRRVIKVGERVVKDLMNAEGTVPSADPKAEASTSDPCR